MNILICGFGEKGNIALENYLCTFFSQQGIEEICTSFSECAEKIYSAPFDMVICSPEWREKNPQVQKCITKAERKAAKSNRKFSVVASPNFFAD